MTEEQHPHGLAYDLATLVRNAPDRRRALRWLAVGSVVPLELMGCGGGSDSATTTTATTTDGTTTTTTTATTPTTTSSTTDTSSTTTTTTTSTTPSSCVNTASETAGPYPGDGSNSNSTGTTQNALLLSGIVRSDIRSSIVGSTTTAGGMPLTITLKLVNTNASCASLEGYAVYLWHCSREGLYSMYSAGITNENYLRGVQVADSNGTVTFTTIFPGCYSGRMPHVHFEVYRSLTTATTTPASDQVLTSQIAWPIAVCNEVYATSGYSASVANLASISFASDNVFSDGTSTEMATVTGSATAGYAATLTVGISA